MSNYTYSNWRNGGGSSDSGPRAKCDQVVFEALAKACEIIVYSRGGVIPSSPISASSSRFNLQVPEVPEVRSILQQYKLSLHVPLRLDVYYQHDEGASPRRELLERWCLEYAPAPTERFLQVEGIFAQDPIVQLRHVCKRMVIWLRTLYCWCKLLPAQSWSASSWSTPVASRSPLGFSLYVHTEVGDDVAQLIQTDGFSWQGPPAAVVTPYGELAWKVIYAPRPSLDPLKIRTRGISASRPIPRSLPAPPQKSYSDEQQEENHHHHHHHHEDSYEEAPEWEQVDPWTTRGVPHSAPAHLARLPAEAKMSTQGTQSPKLMPTHGRSQRNAALPTQQTFDPSRFHTPPPHRAQSSLTGNQEPPRFLPGPHPLTRRHTSIGQTHSSQMPVESHHDPHSPQRVLSGLSLALMASQEDEEKKKNRVGFIMEEKKDPHLALGHNEDEPDQEGSSISEKVRRAALHHVPPHWMEPEENGSHSSTASKRLLPPAGQGTYGYGYNNHIPWQKIHPSHSNPVAGPVEQDARSLSNSPTVPLSSTPPSGAFWGQGTPPSSISHLIPPRSSVTPPFPSRPAGFVTDTTQTPFSHEFPRQLGSSAKSRTKQEEKDSANRTTAVPRTCLDMLHSNPFQNGTNGSLIASMTIGGIASDSVSLAIPASGDFKRSLWNGNGAALNGYSPGPVAGAPDEEIDLPFAVDLPATPVAGGSSFLEPSSLAASAAVASFAHKGATTNRLKLFESTRIEKERGDSVIDLASQLAEFRSFGESL